MCQRILQTKQILSTCPAKACTSAYDICRDLWRLWAEVLRVGGRGDVEEDLWNEGGRRGGRGWRRVEVCVVDAVAVVFAYVEVGHHCRDEGVWDVVCGAPDLGGGCWGVGLNGGAKRRDRVG